MRDNPIHTFFQFMTGNIPDQLALGNARWLVVLLYWAILIAAIAVAVYNWQRDPSQRTSKNVAIFSIRMLAAGMWYLGTLWKLPLPVSDGFKFWMDSTVKYSSFEWHASIMQVFVDHIAVAQPLVYLLEVFFTVSLMTGFMVRISGVLAALFTLNLMIGLYNDPTEWPWTYMGIICTHAMFAITQAGRSLGVDNLVAKGLIPTLRNERLATRAFRWACSAA